MSSSISTVSELPKPAIDGLLCKLLEGGKRLGNSPMDCNRLAFITSSCKNNIVIDMLQENQSMQRTYSWFSSTRSIANFTLILQNFSNVS